MRFLPFKESTRAMAPPKSWDQELDGPCGTLEICDHVDIQSGANFMYSLWRPSREELVALADGGAVRLGIMGTSHPVVNMAVVTADTCLVCGVEDPEETREARSC